jgi:uncharacterized protein YcbX
VITLAELYVYPVKSCRGVALDAALLLEAGFEHDREWMIVTPEGRFLTQRELPRLALIAPQLDADRLTLSAPDASDLVVPLAARGEPREAVVWGDRCRAFDAGAAAADWLGAFLGRPARLVRFDASQPRYSDARWAGDTGATTRFTDGYALLAIARASFDDLNARLPVPLPMDRFRPSIVLDGLAPYAEDQLRDFQLGGVHLRGVKPCTRCVVTTTRQSTGEVDGVEPLKTLKGYRWNEELRGVTFGQNVVVVGGAGRLLERGMPVSIA